MYLKCGHLDLARQLFDEMPERNIVSWNSLICGYTQRGLYTSAVSLFNEARAAKLELNKYAYSSMLSVCSHTEDLGMGRMIHGLIVVNGLGARVLVTNSLLDMYSKCGRIDQAKLVFDKSEELDSVSWNSLIAGYVRGGLNDKMLRTLVGMHRCGEIFGSYVLGSVLKACCSNFSCSVEWGKILHSCTVKLGWVMDVVVGTALLDMYAKIGDLDDATLIFSLLPNKNVVMYNAMIAGLFRKENVNAKFVKRGLNLFLEMQKNGLRPSTFTFSTIIKGCIANEEFDYGKQIHALVCKHNLESDEFIGSALVELYSLLRSTDDAQRCFNETTKLDIVTWTSMIEGHVQNGQFESALALFCKLLTSGTKPDEFTISIMLSACANLASAQSGEQIQGYSIKTGISNSTVIQNSLIYMYAKSGDIDAANRTFEVTSNPDIVSWSVMIGSTGHHGSARKALSLFDLMKDCGIAPNDVAFLGVLSACSHGGLVEEGIR